MPSPLALVEEVVPLLRTRRFGRWIEGFERIDSTNTAALRRAAEGVPEGAVVLAEYQTAGRGRLGRSWQAAAGQNLIFSLVLRPALAVERLGLLSLAASVAAAEAVAAYTAPLSPTIKWPNDLLLEGRKCCGMLLESTFGGSGADRTATVILGTGLNVNQADFPPPLSATATSLLLATGRPVARAPLLARLLERLEHHYTSLQEDGGETVRRAYEHRLHRQGGPMRFRLTLGDDAVEGTFDGITETGGLRLRTPAGLRTYHAGEITTQAGDLGS